MWAGGAGWNLMSVHFGLPADNWTFGWPRKQVEGKRIGSSVYSRGLTAR
ncbi:hypothetical protein MYBA111488_20945 [Mycobacterium basiliense]